MGWSSAAVAALLFSVGSGVGRGPGKAGSGAKVDEEEAGKGGEGRGSGVRPRVPSPPFLRLRSSAPPAGAASIPCTEGAARGVVPAASGASGRRGRSTVRPGVGRGSARESARGRCGGSVAPVRSRSRPGRGRRFGLVVRARSELGDQEAG